MLPWGAPAQSPACSRNRLQPQPPMTMRWRRESPRSKRRRAIIRTMLRCRRWASASRRSRPGRRPDLTPLQKQLTALAASVADLTQKIGTIDKAQAAPSGGTALALLLLQIREAVEIGRPFDAEYQALMTLSRRPSRHRRCRGAACGAGEERSGEPRGARRATAPAGAADRSRRAAGQIELALADRRAAALAGDDPAHRWRRADPGRGGGQRR